MFGDFYRGKNVFITGHTGFKGSWLSMWLSKLGANVTGYALEPLTTPSMFELCSINQITHTIKGDVRDKEALRCAMNSARPDIVFHLAAQSLVRLSYDSPVETFETNIMGTVNVLEAVRQCPTVRSVVNVTTDKCYENQNLFWGYKENDRLGGYEPYSSSKACSELVTESYRNSFFHPDLYDRHKVAIATARAGNVIGGGDYSMDRLVPDCIRGIVANETIHIRNPLAIRPWQHVLEPLAGYLKLAQLLYLNGPEYSGAWNFGPNEQNEKNVQYIVGKICELWSGESKFQVDTENHPHETLYLKLDSYKAKKRIGFKPKLDIDQSLLMTLDWTKVAMNEIDRLYDFTMNQINAYEQLV